MRKAIETAATKASTIVRIALATRMSDSNFAVEFAVESLGGLELNPDACSFTELVVSFDSDARPLKRASEAIRTIPTTREITQSPSLWRLSAMAFAAFAIVFARAPGAFIPQSAIA